MNPAPSPAFRAAVRNAAQPHARAAFANQMFELSAKAVPRSSRSSPGPCRCVSRMRGVFGAADHPSAGHAYGRASPCCTANAATKTLKTDPGGYSPCVARLKSGAFRPSRIAAAKSPSSADGLDTKARISPDRGSNATTAPLRPASPSYATRCNPASSVSRTSSAAPRRNRSSGPRGTVKPHSRASYTRSAPDSPNSRDE